MCVLMWGSSEGSSLTRGTWPLPSHFSRLPLAVSGRMTMATRLFSRRGVIHRATYHARRGIVISSVEPPLDVPIERPERIVLAESSLYESSWVECAESFFPSNGLHFVAIDIMRALHNNTNNDDVASQVKRLEQAMAEDLSNLGEVTDDVGQPTSTSAHDVLIARGPIQCLIAQYYVESLPLAGVVLIDPLLLPEDGRAGIQQGGSKNRWKPSVLDLVSMLENKAPHQHEIYKKVPPPLLLPAEDAKLESSLKLELSLLQSLADDKAYNNPRPLRLEPGSLPILVMYSGDHVYHDYYRISAERTAAFHTCGGSGDYFDQVSVLKISRTDDLDGVMKRIYEWYDDVVA